MAPFRFCGPICKTKDLYEEIEDGTLARMPSPLPSTIGATPSAGPVTASRVVATGKCSFINPKAGGTVRAPKEAFDRLRVNSGKAKISAPQSKGSQTWPGKSSSPALEQEIEIDNQKIKLIRPTDDLAGGKNLPTTEQVAEALRAIPAAQRAYTNTVILSPTPAPGSTATRTIAGEASSGEIDLYPVAQAQSQEDFDNRLMHESGHNYQEKLWGGPEGVRAWQEAADADDRRPSPYAAENAGEDFCEFNILYNTTKGASCEAKARQIYPNRWKKRQDY
jgi:hypothetical protein